MVMHGIAHVDPSGKEEPTEPVQDVAKIAKRQVQVLATPEHNTTTLCAGCQKEAQKWGQRHRSIRCRSTECVEQRRRCRKDRDVNACKSI
jgi:transposase